MPCKTFYATKLFVVSVDFIFFPESQLDISLSSRLSDGCIFLETGLFRDRHHRVGWLSRGDSMLHNCGLWVLQSIARGRLDQLIRPSCHWSVVLDKLALCPCYGNLLQWCVESLRHENWGAWDSDARPFKFLLKELRTVFQSLDLVVA